MKIVISPAKSLDFETKIPTEYFTEPSFLKKSKVIHKVIKEKSPKKLSELMHISDKLGMLNWQRNQDWDPLFTIDNARQAVFAFNGEVYSGLDAYTLSMDKLEILQKDLRILSGLYGLLKPLDLIQPYRLEMGTKLSVKQHKNLYEFWKKGITKALNAELKDGELFVNLASKEYFGVIDVKALKVSVITPEFKDYKEGNLKMIGFYAKKARGLMVRYIVDHDIKTIDDLKAFDSEGYCFDTKSIQRK